MSKKISALVVAALLSLTLPQITFGFCNDSVPSEFMDAAKALNEQNVLRGDDNGNCNLGAPLNRIEFSTMVLRNGYTDEDIKDLASMENGTFPDLKQGVWYYDLARAAKFEGLLKGDGGTGNGRFGDGVNAAEAVVITLRGTAISIPDAASGEQWFDPSVNIAKSVGVKTFDPGYKMTRGDAVLLIHQINEKYDAIESAATSYVPGTTTASANRGDLTKLLEEIMTISSEEGNQIYDSLTERQKTSLVALAQNFTVLLHAGLCQSNPNRTITYAYGTMDCSQANAAVAQLETLDETSLYQVLGQLQTELLSVMVREACVEKNYQGDITAESCGQFLGQVNPFLDQYMSGSVDTASVATAQDFYSAENTSSTPAQQIDPSTYQIMSDMSASMHNTSMNIINNIGGGSCSNPGGYSYDGSFCSPY